MHAGSSPLPETNLDSDEVSCSMNDGSASIICLLPLLPHGGC